MALADPFVITDPKITINAVDFKCATRAIELVPDTTKVDIGGYCGAGATRPGNTKWTATVTLMLGYNDGTNDGTWEELLALVGTSVSIVIGPASGATSVTNPSATFSAYIDPVPFVLGELNQTEGSTFDLELTALADPVFATA